MDSVGNAFTCAFLFNPDGTVIPQTGTRIRLGPNDSATGRVNREGIRLDDPFLTTQARALVTQQLTAAVSAGINPNTGVALAAANKAIPLTEIANSTIRFSLRRNYVDLGIRDEKITRETYRIVAGLRGDFNNDWHYELSANFGEHKENNIIASNINRQRFILANDACVPLNPLGDGSVSAAARKYLTVNSSAQGKITQFDVLGFVSGDTSGFFNLPGGPVAFSVGGEYRRESNAYDLDDLTQAGYAFYNAIPSFTAPKFEVTEAYGELLVPILKDKPFFQELSLRGNGRVAHFKGATGTVYAYGGEAIWRPVKDITFRGTYARSVRAPNLSELYSAQSQNFTPAPSDPCSARNLATGSATLKVGKVTFGYQARFITKMYLNTYEDYNGVNGQPPQNTDYAPIVKYPSVFYHDVKLQIDVTPQLNLYLGMDNVTNRMPPFGLTGVGAGSGIYDIRGRYMHAGFVTKF